MNHPPCNNTFTPLSSEICTITTSTLSENKKEYDKERDYQSYPESHKGKEEEPNMQGIRSQDR